MFESESTAVLRATARGATFARGGRDRARLPQFKLLSFPPRTHVVRVLWSFCICSKDVENHVAGRGECYVEYNNKTKRVFVIMEEWMGSGSCTIYAGCSISHSIFFCTHALSEDDDRTSGRDDRVEKEGNFAS